MKFKITFSLLLISLSSILQAQNGLKDIPDTAVEAQIKAFNLPEGAKML